MMRTQVLKLLPGAREGKRGESKGDVRGRATDRGAMEKSRYVWVIEGKEIRENGPFECFLFTRVGSFFESQRG